MTLSTASRSMVGRLREGIIIETREAIRSLGHRHQTTHPPVNRSRRTPHPAIGRMTKHEVTPDLSLYLRNPLRLSRLEFTSANPVSGLGDHRAHPVDIDLLQVPHLCAMNKCGDVDVNLL